MSTDTLSGEPTLIFSKKFFKKMISANSQESIASSSGIDHDVTTEAELLEDN
jgi:hypothetical protein